MVSSFSSVRSIPSNSQPSSGRSALSSRGSLSDQWYWDLIEKYKDNPEAYSYLSANPYLFANNARFSPTFGQNILSMFGDTSAEDEYYNNLHQQAMAYLSDWEKGQYEQAYNSPIEQVKRESAAGLNPDLSPGSISPGSAAENDQPFSPVSMPGAGSGFQDVHTLANFGVQFLGSVLSFGKQIQELNIGSMNRVVSELGAGSHARDMVLEELANVDPATLEKSLSEPDGVQQVLNLRVFKGYSRKTRAFLQHFLERYNSGDTLGYQTLIAELRNRKIAANQSTANIMSSPYYSEDLNEWSNNIMENYSKYVAAYEKYSAQVLSDKSHVESTLYGDDNVQDVYGNVLADELNARGAEARATNEAAKYRKEMESAWNELSKSVRGDGDHWYNTIGSILLMWLRTQMSSPFHFGFSQSGQVSDSYGPRGTSHSGGHSSSWHF